MAGIWLRFHASRIVKCHRLRFLDKTMDEKHIRAQRSTRAYFISSVHWNTLKFANALKVLMAMVDKVSFL